MNGERGKKVGESSLLLDEAAAAARAAAAGNEAEGASLGAAAAGGEDSNGFHENPRLSIDGTDSVDLEAAGADVTPPPAKLTWREFLRYVGPGWLVCIAYVDPGNYQADIQSGAETGYAMLWVVLWTSLLSIYVQVLCVRLGQCTRKTLSQAMADEYPRTWRVIFWAVAEFMVIITDLPEVIGIGFALKLLAGWDTWVGVMLSAVTTMLFLMTQHWGTRVMEGIVLAFVGAMSVLLLAEWVLVGVDGTAFVRGITVPDIPPGGTFAAAGVLGAVVMPHNLFLHTAAVQSRKVPRTPSHIKRAVFLASVEPVFPILVTIVINCCITSLAAERIYGQVDPDTGELLADEVQGNSDFCKFLTVKNGCLLWALTLLAAGQSSAITTTYSGQYIMDGFLQMRLPMWKRAILTRLSAIIPAVLVAVFGDDSSLNQMVNFVNASLALLLPFALVPLVKFCTSRRKMGMWVANQTESVFMWALTGAVLFINFWVAVAPGGGMFGSVR